MKIKITSRDVIWNYVGTLLSMASNFVLLPFLLHYLSAEEIGVWYIFLAMNGLVMLFDLGFDPTFARNIAYVWSGATSLARDGAQFDKQIKAVDSQLFNTLIKTCQYIYQRIALIATFFLVSIGSCYLYLVASHLVDLTNTIAWILFCLSLYINLYLGYFSALLRGIGKVAELNKALTVSRLSQLSVTTILLFLNSGLLAVSVGFLINGFVLRIICRRSFYGNNEVQRITKTIGRVTKREVLKLYQIVSYNAFRDGRVAIANYLATQATSIIASFYLSLEAVGVYAISVQLATAIVSAAAAYVNTYHPAFQAAYLAGNLAQQRKIVKRGFAVFYLIAIVGAMGVLMIGLPILTLIKPSIHFNQLVFLGYTGYMILWQQQSISASFISNTNEIPYVRAFEISAVLSVIAGLVFCQFLGLGVWGLILGPALVQALYNNWRWTGLVFKRLEFI